MSFLHVDGCADYCACLHLSDFRISYSKTASTMTHHRVELMQTSDDCFDLLNRFALCVSQFLDVLFLSRNELMKRRIQETDGNRVASRASYSFSKSPCCSGRILASAASLSSTVSAQIISRNASILLPSKTYALYGKDQYLLRQAHELF